MPPGWLPPTSPMSQRSCRCVTGSSVGSPSPCSPITTGSLIACRPARPRTPTWVFPAMCAVTSDVLGPAPGAKLESNQEIGGLSVDLIPGLLAALLLEPVNVSLVAHLTDGTELAMTLALPDVRGALILKVFAYAGRFTDRDASDVWRLLEAAVEGGFAETDWPQTPVGREAAHLLHQFFGSPAASGAKKVSARPADQARVRLLLQRVVPRP